MENNLLTECNKQFIVCKKKKIAIYIGRFAPLHNGHIEVINYCNNNYDEAIVIINRLFSIKEVNLIRKDTKILFKLDLMRIFIILTLHSFLLILLMILLKLWIYKMNYSVNILEEQCFIFIWKKKSLQ
jgi:cytidyltransferase-like protein